MDKHGVNNQPDDQNAAGDQDDIQKHIGSGIFLLFIHHSGTEIGQCLGGGGVSCGITDVNSVGHMQ